LEVQNREKLEATITTLTSEILLLREQQQRLHLIEAELKTTRAIIKQQEENEEKVETLKQENIGLRKANIILTELEKCNNRFKLKMKRQNSQLPISRPGQTQLLMPPAASNLSAHTNTKISSCVKSVEFLNPSSKQQASQLEAHIKKLDPHIDTNITMPSLSPFQNDFESKKKCQYIPPDYPPRRLIKNPCAVQSIPLPSSARSAQLCETDVFFLKSFREMLTSLTSKNKPVETNFDESRKLEKYHLTRSEVKKINRSNPNAAKSRKRVSKRNREKKKKSNALYATQPKSKLIRKSVQANRGRPLFGNFH